MLVPDGACDSHLHIIDPASPARTPTAPGMTLDDYRPLQRRLGLTRAVIVQAKHYGTDNACLIDALAGLGANARGIAVVTEDVQDAELHRLDQAGVRGLRFSLWNPADAVVTLDMLDPLARRIAPLGWHIQLHMHAAQIQDAAPILTRLPCPLVIDHMARLPPAQGSAHPAFATVARLLQAGRTWLKLSGAYLNTTQGPPAYPDATAIAQAFVKQAPDRLLWGSDWPHVTEAQKPDAALLLDLLPTWMQDAATTRRILVDNPARLYFDW